MIPRFLTTLSHRQKMMLGMAAVLLFLLVCAQLIRTATARDLVLHVSPAGATVKIDGTARTGTGLKIDPGSHVVEVSKDGYLTQSRPFNIVEGKTTSLTVNLVKKTPESLTEYVFRNAVYSNYPGQDIKVLSAKNLYGGVWILGTVLIGGEEERLVLLQQDDTAAGYSLYLSGPPYNVSKLKQLPDDVQSEIKATTADIGATD